MNAIETKTLERNGQTVRIRIYADAYAPNPLEAWSEMGTILSLNSWHNNHDPAGIGEAIETNADAVKLSYYEHGICRWSVSGELPAADHCPWDSVSFAGIWLPDAETLESAKPYGGRTRQLFMRKLPAKPAKSTRSGATATSTVMKSSVTIPARSAAATNRNRLIAAGDLSDWTPA